MTETPFPLMSLWQPAKLLIKIMVGQMPEAHRRFLIQFERGEPDWSLLGCRPLPDCLLSAGGSTISTS